MARRPSGTRDAGLGKAGSRLTWDEIARDLDYPDEKTMLRTMLQWGWSRARIGRVADKTAMAVSMRLKRYQLNCLTSDAVPLPRLRWQAKVQAHLAKQEK